MSGASQVARRTAIASLRPFGVVSTARPNGFSIFVIAGGIAAVISATQVGAAALNAMKTLAFAHGFGPAAVFSLLVGAPGWGIYVVLPFFALRGAIRGRILGRILLTVVALFNFALLFQPGPEVLRWVNAVSAAGFFVAAILGWLLPRTPALVVPNTPAPSVRRRRFKSAAIMFGVAGMLGVHALYLRRGWQFVLYIGLLLFGYLTAGSPLGVALILVSSLMLFTDFARLDTLIDLANDRSLAKS